MWPRRRRLHRSLDEFALESLRRRRGLRGLSRAVRRALEKLMSARANCGPFASIAALTALATQLASAALAAPVPQHGGSTQRAQRAYSPQVPSAPQHAEYVVEINRKGQVTRVRSGKPSHDLAFNTMTYGNALQAFIRTADGRAIPGIYRLGYDYAPKTKNVRRSVAIVRAGGVNPNTPGAVDRMTADAKRRAAHAGEPTGRLPDFESIEKSH
jgi:hypothetical protein